MNSNMMTGAPAGANPNQGNMKTVYTIVERGPGKSFWTKVGVGFTNRDGSINLHLDAIPVNGRLQIRDYEPWERRPPQGDTGGDPLGPRARAALAPPRDTNPDSLI
jgi:hypothetical protein